MSKTIRAKTKDVAIQYRMNAGFSGDVNRTHPASIEPVQVDTTTPPEIYGMLGILDGASHNFRRFTTGDASQAAYGLFVRPYPFQQQSGTNYGSASIGNATPATGPGDVLRAGYGMAQVNAGQTAPVKGGAVYVRVAATAGNNVIGQLETASSAGNNVLVTNAKFQGGMDANNVAEIVIYMA